jgi:hypothetical protein
MKRGLSEGSPRAIIFQHWSQSPSRSSRRAASLGRWFSFDFFEVKITAEKLQNKN